jgi:hypothetical protein
MSETIKTGKIHLVRHSDAYWRVTFDLPPLNISGPANIPQLEEVVSALESDDRVKVVVFGSAVEGFFLTHYDFLAKLEDSTKYPAGPTGLQPLPDMFARLSRAAVASNFLDSWTRDRRRQRTSSCQRHAFCQSGKGDPVAMGGRSRSGSRGRTYGSTATFDRTGKSYGSVVGSG